MARAGRGSSPSSKLSYASWFAAWAVVGGVYATGIAGAFTIGVVALPLAIVATIVLSGRRAGLVGIPGAGIGVAAVLFYLAYVNRSGPGTVCTRTAGAGMRCVDETSPWPWLAGGVALVVIAVVLFAVLQRRAAARRWH